VVDSVNSTQDPVEVPLKLTLKKKESDKKIKWSEGTVDNEGMGKKKSKCCCVYKKPRQNLDDSSDSDSDDEGNCSSGCSGHKDKSKK